MYGRINLHIVGHLFQITKIGASCSNARVERWTQKGERRSTCISSQGVGWRIAPRL